MIDEMASYSNPFFLEKTPAHILICCHKLPIAHSQITPLI